VARRRADLGLIAVALWTIASSAFLVVRLIMGIRERQSTGQLHSWFSDVDPEAQKPTLTQRCFSTAFHE